MSRLLVLFILILSTSLAWSQNLVLSIQPLYLIAKEVTQGIETPTLLLADQTGHDVSLTPAHRKMIQDAALVIWLGQAHEAPLAKILDQDSKAISILDSQIVHTLSLRNVRGEALKNTVDTHVWLDPNNAVRIGFFIAALRSQQHPEHKAQYWANAKSFAQKMLITAQQYQNRQNNQAYWAYHDAYQYLERALNLSFAGALTADPHIAPTVAQLKYLNDLRPYQTMCLLAEGHASENQYRTLKPIVFQNVDESMADAVDFVQAWQKLASQTQKCILNAHK